MLLTISELIKKSGRSKPFVYKTLRKNGIELSDFYDDSVLRYLTHTDPCGLLTIDDLCKAADSPRTTVALWLSRAGIKAALRDGHRCFYGSEALSLVTRRKREIEAEKKAQEKRAAGKREEEKKRFERLVAGFARRKEKPGFYFVSVQDFFGHWAVKAVCLSYLDARMVSEELSALGIKAHFRSHKWSAKKKA